MPLLDSPSTCHYIEDSECSEHEVDIQQRSQGGPHTSTQRRDDRAPLVTCSKLLTEL